MDRNNTALKSFILIREIRLCVFFICILGVCACSKIEDHYRSVLTNGVLTLADPYILEDDGMFYMYGTLSKSGIIVCKSENLYEWSDCCGNANFNLALYRSDVWGDKNFWAPEVYKVNGKYIMTYTSEMHICYAESDSPCGPFVQNNKCPYLYNENGIDSSIFIDDDGQAYICWDRQTESGGIWIAKMSPDLQNINMSTANWALDVSHDTWENLDGWICEGPQIIKHESLYYMIYSCNTYTSAEYAVGYAVSDKPMGPYKKYAGNPILYKHGGYDGTGHASILQTSTGDYYIVYHAHNKNVNPRITLISPIVFEQNELGEYIIRVSDEVIQPNVVL